ncbi:hypothetical protein GIB67_038575 [Kingdonia uniflora]|uniref:cysteine dioxygenase n=1 Tax=Kingdonia uniflora TaxID=39325 RepID=A0A7J7NQ72_9MAGN|nr:hypothetical protein GIB67_038575 [Kingdonia uniflora]
MRSSLKLRDIGNAEVAITLLTAELEGLKWLSIQGGELMGQFKFPNFLPPFFPSEVKWGIKDCLLSKGKEPSQGDILLFCDRMCIFCLPTSSVIPLHDHPGMTVLSKILYGSMHVKAYDWVEPACIQRTSGFQVRLAKLALDKVLTAPCHTSVLYPKSGGNVHCFTAITPCAMLDVLAPPYRESAGRRCTYYHDYPYSAFPTRKGAEICDGEEDSYVWLKEIDTPGDLYMRTGEYTGPSIKVSVE